MYTVRRFLQLLCLFVSLGAAGALLAAPQSPAAKRARKGTREIELLVSGGTVVTMDPARRIIEDGAVAIHGDQLLAVGSRAELEARFPHPARRIDARGRIILPGLINGHTHAAMTLLRGIANDLNLQDWLEKYIFPAEAHNVTKDFVTWGTRLAALEMIRGGTTTFADMYYFEDSAARETKAAGLRGVLGESVIDFPVPDAKTPDEALANIETYLQRWKGDSLIHAAIAAHSPYTCSAETLKKVAALARRYSAPILIHVSETKRERDESYAKRGMSPVAYLDSLGFLGPDVVAAHCVWFDDKDIAVAASRGVGCVHNPSSNMMLASGTAPVVEMLRGGLRLGLGTDGPAGSNNDLDMMEEIDLAAKLQKVTRLDPRALSAEQALEMATIGGARALHMENEIGSLEPGKKADLILLRTDAPHAVPMYDVVSQVAYSLKASDVETVIVGGRILMEGRRMLTLNEPEILAKARDYSQKVKRSLVGEKK